MNANCMPNVLIHITISKSYPPLMPVLLGLFAASVYGGWFYPILMRLFWGRRCALMCRAGVVSSVRACPPGTFDAMDGTTAMAAYMCPDVGIFQHTVLPIVPTVWHDIYKGIGTCLGPGLQGHCRHAWSSMWAGTLCPVGMPGTAPRGLCRFLPIDSPMDDCGSSTFPLGQLMPFSVFYSFIPYNLCNFATRKIIHYI